MATAANREQVSAIIVGYPKIVANSDTTRPGTRLTRNFKPGFYFSFLGGGDSNMLEEGQLPSDVKNLRV